MTVNKSKRILGNALLELMNEKPYSSISIYEITKKAYVSRTTFYNHFTKKDDIIYFLIEDVLYPLTQMEFSPDSFDFINYLVAYLNVLMENSAFFMLLRRHGLIQFAPKYVARKIRECISSSDGFACLFGERADADLFCEYESQISFFSLFWFINHRSAFTNQELARIIYETRRIGWRQEQQPVLSGRSGKDPYERFLEGDIRSRRTIEALYAAVNRILETKRPQDISITDLTKEAGIARCSFYRHFLDVESLIEDNLQRIYAEIIRSIPNQGRLVGYGKIMNMSIHGYEKYRSLFASLAKNNFEMAALRAYRANIDVLKWQLPYIKEYMPTSPFSNEYYQWFLAVEHIIPIMMYFRLPQYNISNFSEQIQMFRYFPFRLELGLTDN